MKTPLLLAALLAFALPVAAADSPALKAMEEYLEFTEYGSSIILPEQIPAEDWPKFHLIDTRDAEQYAMEHIPGAVNIEWRQVLARRNEIPKDKPVLVYCNTGTLSSQAGFVLRFAGMDNVRILQGGIRDWKAKGGFNANQKAQKQQTEKTQ